MTITETIEVPTAVAVDLYRDIHKAIRVELFTITAAAGRTDPHDVEARTGLAAAVRGLVGFLDDHAEHEDGAILPVLEVHLPELADQISRDHHLFDGRGAYLTALADAAVEAGHDQQRALVHHLYLDLAGFTSIYLAHQDLEERTLMPALEAAVGPEQTFAIHQQILGSIPPDEMARSLAMMLPAMNLDDRTEMLGAMQQEAPVEVFQGVWGLAGSVLAPQDLTALGNRLGLV
jgi:hypothetical protein